MILSKALRKNAGRGEENCIYVLGDYYRKGIMVLRDEKKAFEVKVSIKRVI